MYVSNSPPKVQIVIPKKTKQGNNFSVEEDNLLVLAWLNTSVDVVHSNEQKQETFCEKIWQYFYKHNAFGTICIPTIVKVEATPQSIKLYCNSVKISIHQQFKNTN